MFNTKIWYSIFPRKKCWPKILKDTRNLKIPSVVPNFSTCSKLMQIQYIRIPFITN